MRTQASLLAWVAHLLAVCGRYEYNFAARDISKSETWGSKQNPDVTIRVRCRACGEVWRVSS